VEILTRQLDISEEQRTRAVHKANETLATLTAQQQANTLASSTAAASHPQGQPGPQFPFRDSGGGGGGGATSRLQQLKLQQQQQQQQQEQEQELQSPPSSSSSDPLSALTDSQLFYHAQLHTELSDLQAEKVT